MDFSRVIDPNAWKQAMAGLLRRGGEVTDFIATAPEKAGQSILDAGERQRALMNKAFDPTGKTLIRDPQAANQAAMNLLEGPLGFAPAGITAWHGSPHTFEKFDMSKVGTGEGAQVYGHGMYFAEAPSVAESYKSKLSGGLGSPSNELIVNGKPLTNLSDAQRRAYEIVARDGRKNALGTAKDLESQGFDASHIREALKSTKGKEVNLIKNEGNLYKVDIPDQHIPYMLDYDKPIKDQPEIYELVKSRFTDPDLLKTFETNAASGISGANVYKNYLGGKNDKERSENALALGIKGIRYLDEGSRKSKITSTPITQLDAKIEILKKDINSGLGNQDVMKQKLKNLEDERARSVDMTSNFVVFEPSTVKLLERNSEPLTRKEILQEQLDKIAK